MLSAQEALAHLREGNRRFVVGSRSVGAPALAARRAELTAGQEPFAVILGCSDSRVPPEIVFDQGLGDLFVVRGAGNTVTPSEIGSVEFAVQYLGTRLVVVLGHTNCGAVRAALEDLEPSGGAKSPNLGSIVERIRPSVDWLVTTDAREDLDSVLRSAMRANVCVSVETLRRQSEIIARLAEDAGLLVVGAEYDLETGWVSFLGDSLPDGRDG
jgi:carbonic anhydrase